LPDGMKLIVYGPGGVLENAISLIGFDCLCMLLVDDQDLVKDIFDAVGQRLVRYYEICAQYDSIGALISNDDWGFKTGTMLSPADLRRYVFPWHKKIAATIHAAGKPAILHSCGKLDEVMDDVIDDMKYDAKHSFEDVIMPIEEAYELWSDRIAILGGIDVDFICRSSPEQIRERCKGMLAKAEEKGGYALGTGNSVPEYVPYDNYLAMIDCVLEMRD
jgi:uroporphyrinogen decarboxylase